MEALMTDVNGTLTELYNKITFQNGEEPSIETILTNIADILVNDTENPCMPEIIAILASAPRVRDEGGQEYLASYLCISGGRASCHR
jgi:hypothetical protein